MDLVPFNSLKGKFTQKVKFSHYLLTVMVMEGQVKFFSPQDSAGVSQEKDIAVISQTVDINGYQDLNIIKTHNKSIKCLHTACLK